MIQVKGNDISSAYGDTFDLIFNIVGFEIEETAKKMVMIYQNILKDRSIQ